MVDHADRRTNLKCDQDSILHEGTVNRRTSKRQEWTADGRCRKRGRREENFTMAEITRPMTLAMPAPISTGTVTTVGTGIEPDNGSWVAALYAECDPPQLHHVIHMDHGCTEAAGEINGAYCLSARTRERISGTQDQPLCIGHDILTRVWTAVRNGCGFFNEWNYFSKNAGRDLIVVDIKTNGEKITHNYTHLQSKSNRNKSNQQGDRNAMESSGRREVAQYSRETSTPTTIAGTQGAQNRGMPYTGYKLWTSPGW